MSDSWPSEAPSGSWWSAGGARIGAGVRESDATSTVGARAAAFVAVALAFGALADTTGRFDVLAWSGGALWVGIALGEIREVRSLATRMPGWVIGLLVVVTLMLVWAVLASREVVDTFAPHILLFAVVGAGLDWTWVTRLRGYILASGFLVVPLVFEPDRGDILLSIAWLVAAIGALWFLQRDSMNAWPQARPLRTGSIPAHNDDLFWVAGAAVSLGMLAALLLGNPSCQLPWDRSTDTDGFEVVDSARLDQGAPGEFDQGGRFDEGGTGGFDDQQGGRLGEDTRGGGSGGGSDPSGSAGGGSGGGSGRQEDQLGGSGSTGGSSGTESGEGGSRLGESADEDDAPSLLPIIFGVVAVLAVGALVLWLLRRRGGPTSGTALHWAIALSRRLAVEGARRGRPRAASETITSYAGALGDGPLADPRLRDVGALVSAALFGRVELPEPSRSWAEAVVAEAVELNPPSDSRSVRRNVS